MASTKVGDGLSYQAVVRVVSGLPELCHTAVWEVSSSVRVVPSYQDT